MGDKYKVLSLFAGIGGFDLGLERTGGFKTVCFAETDPYASRVLARHWPHVPNVGDVTKAEFPNADVICAGFPCQDISVAGLGAGLSGARSGLWREVVRAVRVVRPLYTLLENVAALTSRGLATVLGDLAEIGHDAEWDCISANQLGAPHRRDRIWIVAYPHGNGDFDFGAAGTVVADQKAVEGWRRGLDELGPGDGLQRNSSYAGIRRMVHGISSWTHRLRSLGNAVVPQIPELIGRAILASRKAA